MDALTILEFGQRRLECASQAVRFKTGCFAPSDVVFERRLHRSELVEQVPLAPGGKVQHGEPDCGLIRVTRNQPWLDALVGSHEGIDGANLDGFGGGCDGDRCLGRQLLPVEHFGFSGSQGLPCPLDAGGLGVDQRLDLLERLLDDEIVSAEEIDLFERSLLSLTFGLALPSQVADVLPECGRGGGNDKRQEHASGEARAEQGHEKRHKRNTGPPSQASEPRPPSGDTAVARRVGDASLTPMNPLPRDPRSIHVASDATPAAGGPAVSPDLPDAEVSRRRRWPWVVALLAVFVLVPTLGLSVAAWSTWRGVERVDLSGVLSDSPSGTNYLIVGTDNRDGVATDIENAGVIFGEGVSGERTDTIALMRVEGDAVSLLAIPRDLYVPLDGGAPNRINAAFAFGGPAALIRTVQQELGIPVDHYLEVDFAGFLGLVDALGGVTLDFPHPAFDERSGLAIDVAGPVELDSIRALAYVRSRRYTELIDGQLVTDPTSDLGRVERQQRFLGAVMAEFGATRNPLTLLGALGAVADHVRVDGDLGLVDAAKLGLTLRGAEPETATIPTDRFITSGGADVLVLGPESETVLASFRG